MKYVWFPNALPLASAWIPYEVPVDYRLGPSWSPSGCPVDHGFPVGSVWVPYDFAMERPRHSPMNPQRVPYGFPMDALWIPREFPMDPLVVPYGCPMGCIWVDSIWFPANSYRISCGFHMGSVQPPGGPPLNIMERHALPCPW